jgi:hypothetical protein
VPVRASGRPTLLWRPRAHISKRKKTYNYLGYNLASTGHVIVRLCMATDKSESRSFGGGGVSGENGPFYYFNCNFSGRRHRPATGHSVPEACSASRPVSEIHIRAVVRHHVNRLDQLRMVFHEARVQSNARRGRAESARKPVAPVLLRQNISA